ncbi:MAG: helix-turn-helix domain-containing protein [Parvularculaceae bacterium]
MAQIQIHLDSDFIAGAASDAGLNALACVKHLKPGETLYVEAESAGFCYQILSGVMKEYNTLEDGRRQVAEFYSDGAMIGLSAEPQHLHTAEAVTPCAVRCFPREAFMHAAAASPELSQALLNETLMRLDRARERMVMIGRMSAMQRVASFLLRLAADQDARENVSIFMSRQDIADHLGLTIETVCRALTELKKVKAVSMSSTRVFSIAEGGCLETIAMGARARLH